MNNKKCETRGKYSNCYSTAELIAELERRKPDCRKCAWPTWDLCLGCFWKDFGGEDIFKAEVKKHV
jgi:hypothetical protein